jgi:hypothetical protein
MTMKLASSPSRNSSITTRAPASPSLLPVSIMSTAAWASSSGHRHHHALAGGQAVGLDHDGRALGIDIGMGGGGIGEGLELRRSGSCGAS